VLLSGCEDDMLDLKKDIQAMTRFRRNPAKFLRQLKKTKKPLILTVNGKAEAVVQDAEAYQRLLDIAARADEAEGIRQGLEDVKKGRVRPARDVLKEIRRKRGIKS
jgi:prevent-host-death family protein